MKATLAGLLRLKPFDESADASATASTYAKSRLIALGIVLSAALAAAALVMTIVGGPAAMMTLGVALSSSAVTAALEWHAGLKAKALNQLFVTATAALAIALLAQT